MESWLSPLFDAEGIRAVDRWAIEEQGIAGAELMEAAGTALAEAVAGLAPQGPVRIVCGKGNNGGDGLVAARHLRRLGFEVEALELEKAESGELDAWLEGSGAVVDAIFGTGFSGVAREPAAGAIEAINRCDAPVVACDIASGVDASSGEIEGAAVEADLTISFHAAKLGHRIAPGKWHTGELRVEPIGIPDGAPSAPAGGDDRARRPRPAARAGFALDQVQLWPGGDRGRVEGFDRRGADVLAGGDQGRRRLRDGRRPGRPRGDLRELAARGDVGRLPGRRRLSGASRAEGDPQGLRARRGGRARPRHGP